MIRQNSRSFGRRDVLRLGLAAGAGALVGAAAAGFGASVGLAGTGVAVGAAPQAANAAAPPAARPMRSTSRRRIERAMSLM